MDSYSPTVPKPDHVADALVYDFDHFHDPEMLTRGYDRLLEVARETPPVFWTPRNGGHWIISSHAAVFEASRAPERFTTMPVTWETLQAMMAATPEGEPLPLIAAPNSIDPPHHAAYRGPLQSVFAPKAMLGLKDSIRELAVELLEAVKPDGGCEFMSSVAEPLPVTVFLRLFGLPVERQRQYRDLVKKHFSTSAKRDGATTLMRLRELADVMHDTIVDRRDNPKDDIISMLWQAVFDGRPATMHDLESYCVMLFSAGLDTVMNGMGLGVDHLARNPDLQARLRAEPGLIVEASEEIMRRYTFTTPLRFSVLDQEFAGATIKQGEIALLFLPFADLDPAEFPEPANFDLARENKTHIAFGGGPHRCLGSHLARIELQVLYEEILARLPLFRIDPERPVAYHGGYVLGPEKLYLKWSN